MKCPRCRLFNPDEAERCDCGYEFASGEVKGSFLPRKASNPARVMAGRGLMALGALVCLGGLGLTVASFNVSPSGQGRVVMLGMMVSGGLMFLQGASQMSE